MVLYKEIHLNNPKQDNKSILRTINHITKREKNDTNKI